MLGKLGQVAGKPKENLWKTGKTWVKLKTGENQENSLKTEENLGFFLESLLQVVLWKIKDYF